MNFALNIASYRVWVLGIILVNGVVSVRADAPNVDPADDEKYLGSRGASGSWTPEQQVASFRNMDKIYPTRAIRAGASPYPLPYDKIKFSKVQIRSRNTVLTIDEYFIKQNVAGLLVIKDGKIVYERYGLGNTENSTWVSYSVTKSIVSMLVGAAIHDGYIENVNEKVTDYLPRLKGSSYDQATIRNILQMSSGVRWNEDYADPRSDVNTATWDTIRLYDYLRVLPRDSEPGNDFNYNTAETNLVGTLLRSAIGNNLSDYLTEKIWKPFGMESDGFWMLTEPGGGEFGGCCVNATLRDYGRIGLFALNKGRLANGTHVLPRGWMAESTSPSKGYAGYGYLWWLLGDEVFSASGIYGQGIYINRKEKIVIALQSSRAAADKESDWGLQNALYVALARFLKD